MATEYPESAVEAAKVEAVIADALRKRELANAHGRKDAPTVTDIARAAIDAYNEAMGMKETTEGRRYRLVSKWLPTEEKT